MIVLSDCLTERLDEGCIKVANSLTRRIKQKYPDTVVVSYNRKPKNSDIHLNLNKLFLNRKLFSLIKSNTSVLYIPFASNTLGSAVRTFMLSLFGRKPIKVIFALRFPMGFLTKLLLKLSKAEIVALSGESYDFYKKEIGNVSYLKTGIDVGRFLPVNAEEKLRLKEKYGIPTDKKLVLHIGHLKDGRNVEKLLDIDDKYTVMLVTSTVTRDKINSELKNKLQNCPNIVVVDTFVEHIEEIYQMSDVYLFPVQKNQNCIDVPLSVLEAAACNIPIVTTEYGELKAFKGEKGMYFVDDLSKEALNRTIDTAACVSDCNNREAVLEYDFEKSVIALMSK